MESKIEILAGLFKERAIIDSKIEEVTGSDIIITRVPMEETKDIEEVKPEIKKGRQKRTACPECGSRGPRHKDGCSKPAYKRTLMDSGFFATKERTKKEIHSYICRDCKTPFKQNLPKIDAFCPSCRSVNIDDYKEPEVIVTKES